jgi:HlyD family secretion protein
MAAGKRSAGTAKGGSGTQRQIWVLQDGRPQAMDVTVGLSDGRHTEVAGPGLREGMSVITEQRSSAERP